MPVGKRCLEKSTLHATVHTSPLISSVSQMKHHPPAAYEALRKKLPVAEINFGYEGITLVPLDKIPEAQRGDSIVPDGESTDWPDSWLVIGHDNSLGDPIFIDASKRELPVLTARHGEGSWSPSEIAPSVEVFFEILARFAELAKNRENPVALEGNPLSEADQNRFYDFVSSYFNGDLPVFWEILIRADL